MRRIASVLFLVACSKFDAAPPDLNDAGDETSDETSSGGVGEGHGDALDAAAGDADASVSDAGKDAGLCCVTDAGEAFACAAPNEWECINQTAVSCLQPGKCLQGVSCFGLINGLPGTVEVCP